MPESPPPYPDFSDTPNATASDTLYIPDQQSLHHVHATHSLPVIPASSTSQSPTVTDQLGVVTTPIHPTHNGVTHMPSSTPLPSEVLENEDTCIAYIHFSSVGYRKLHHLMGLADHQYSKPRVH